MEKRSLRVLSLTSRDVRYHLDAAAALITIIPLLALCYVRFHGAGGLSALSERPFLSTILVLHVLLGYVLLARYPARVIRRRTAELEEANRKLNIEIQRGWRAQQLKDDFVSTVSHELRTPLAIAKEGISLLEDGLLGTLTEKQLKIINTASRNIDRLARIINDLLDIAKIEAGKMDIHRRRIDLVELAKQSVAAMEPMAQKKRLSLSTDMPSTPLEVFADPGRITQVLTNLIGNAVKFTVSGGVSVSGSAADGEAHCTVLDTGPGISESDLPRVFEKFSQIERMEGAGNKGTGLGLSVAKSIIDLHGGRIWAESNPGEGSVFTFSLPLFDDDLVVRAVIGTSLRAAKQTGQSLRLFLFDLVPDSADMNIDEKIAALHSVMAELVDRRALVRGSDAVCRRGDHQIIILAAIESGYVQTVCDRWRETISDAFSATDPRLRVTVCLGSAGYPPCDSVEELLTNAELSLAGREQHR